MAQPQFRVDSRLVILLSENYRSSEAAIKELVDNCWDADADNVWIRLPKPDTADFLVIEDDGTGMTPQELQSEYLVVAKDRISSKGQLTIGKKRKVKGRKGIGKFAGLVTASSMQLETWARGVYTSIILEKGRLVEASRDLEELDLIPTIEEVAADKHGTKVTLSGLNQNLRFPLPEKLRELLIRDYGREEDFTLHVDDEKVTYEHIQGETHTAEANIDGVGRAALAFTVAEARRRFRNAGIAIRVEGKVIGKPHFFGLEDSEDFPKSVLGKIYGEVEADGLLSDVTADWGTVIENSKGYDALRTWVAGEIREAAKKVYGQQIHLAQARLQQKINRRLEQLPEFKKVFAQRALQRLLQKYYDEPDEKLEPLVNVVLEAIERDEYYFIIDKIDKAKRSDIESFARALEESSFVELSMMQHQLTYRLRLIDEFEEIVVNPATLEKHAHQALENRLWIFGPEYSLKSSNIALKRIAEEYLSTKFSGIRASKRPDLLLANDLLGRHSLIEFKRPNHTLTHADYLQAIAYRHDLLANLREMEVIVIGGKRDKGVRTNYTEDDVKLMTFLELISHARSQYNWLLAQLKQRSE
ncbi:MAG TPA: ATP-binding protein [Syntrophorhabdales bacterium]|nr:ATP-binding protein [Syntrophorhabdales bacterium]